MHAHAHTHTYLFILVVAVVDVKVMMLIKMYNRLAEYCRCLLMVLLPLPSFYTAD